MKMAIYMVEMPVAEGQCSGLADEAAGDYQDLLSASWWGCMGGGLDGWVIVNANDVDEALSLVPPSIRGQAKVTEIRRMSVKEMGETSKAA
ncbi:MAG: hypothetical protein ACYC2Y_10685 [Armatimonadota bacterium]